MKYINLVDSISLFLESLVVNPSKVVARKFIYSYHVEGVKHDYIVSRREGLEHLSLRSDKFYVASVYLRLCILYNAVAHARPRHPILVKVRTLHVVIHIVAFDQVLHGEQQTHVGVGSPS